jgi:hypothetical protein
MPDALISYPATKQGLRNALEALGTTGDAVARNLAAMGFKGCVGKASNCPIANYVMASIPEAQDVRVQFGEVSVRTDEDWNTVEQPEPVSDFVELFDGGRLPHLEVSDASS